MPELIPSYFSVIVTDEAGAVVVEVRVDDDSLGAAIDLAVGVLKRSRFGLLATGATLRVRRVQG